MARLDGVVFRSVMLARRDDDIDMAAALGFGKKRDEGGVEIVGAGARQQFGRRAGIENLAAVHGDKPVEAGSLFHIGGGNDDAHAGPACADRIDQFPELPAGKRIDAGRWLIKDQQIRIMDQGAAEAEFLFHAA
ncbi:hypothetical protein D3C71_919570 [compost metagenome]